MNCQKCGSFITLKIKIYGKEHNLKSRKYCLECSPFGEHNTKKLNGEFCAKIKHCTVCGKENVKGAKCPACLCHLRRKRRANNLYQMMGDCCWICGYNKCRVAMDYHHVYPEYKSFQLTLAGMRFPWTRILEEARKCVLLCCRCHREYHGGLIPKEEMYKLYQERWEKIERASSTVW